MSDKAAWGQFASLYGPLIHGYLRHHGLQEADATDVAQETLRKVMIGVGRLE